MRSETFAEGNLKLSHHFRNAVRHAAVAAGGPCLPLGSEWKISPHFHAPDHPKQLGTWARGDISAWPHIRQSIISQTWLRISHAQAHCNEPGLSQTEKRWPGSGRRPTGHGHWSKSDHESTGRPRERFPRREADVSFCKCRASSAASASSQLLNATILGNFAVAFGHTIQ